MEGPTMRELALEEGESAFVGIITKSDNGESFTGVLVSRTGDTVSGQPMQGVRLNDGQLPIGIID